jgi:hypothetical protein
MENLPFEGVFQLSEAALAHLPAIENLGDYLKDIKISSGEDEDESLTFTRAKMFEVCFGLGEMHEAQSDLPAEIRGSENLQREIKTVLSEYRDRFCRQVRREPAALPPFELRLTKTEKWSSSRPNCGRSRPLGPEKHKALKDQVEGMQAVDVIEHSTALHYSQAHLVPKKPRGWRFALDYRELNENSESYAWPIPNIREMFARIGEHRPRYFAVLDLTSG